MGSWLVAAKVRSKCFRSRFAGRAVISWMITSGSALATASPTARPSSPSSSTGSPPPPPRPPPPPPPPGGGGRPQPGQLALAAGGRGHLVAGRHQLRHQVPSDRPGRSGYENLHGRLLSLRL